MDELEKKKASQDVLNKIITLCNLEGVDYFQLEPKVQRALVRVFQLGVGFVQGFFNSKN